ncbi:MULTISPECIES: GntR family transcriptional regulator [unclassified Beijerinckia]|uniref:GntR family transcriptional regulator n=1 Tax=unclassified Beijerinckia TaxID=2638183 RepID=UPI00089BBD11|nr:MULTISPECIES: GntR family transcriptional regulator [unclassified Beijerinckia]MDH7799881.1 GntR family transcriptional regulator of vanillate catabolism [Beijerinckia sp. GAS462]SED40935.1 transcriptional regulator, GntR family [Beijerinckia sp. 28-YEA-48]
MKLVKKLEGDADLAENREQRAIAGLKRLIGDGSLQPGSRIPENAVAQSLGLSRTPMRSALKSLEAENWVVRNSGGGYFVREFTLRDVIDMIRLRGAMERLVIRLAVERGARASDIAELERLAQAMDDTCHPDIDSAEKLELLAELDSEFRKLIVQLADSTLVTSILMRTMSLPFIGLAGLDFETLSKEMRGNLKKSNALYHVMIAAIRDGDGGAGVQAVTEHMDIFIATMRAVIDSSGGRSS